MKATYEKDSLLVETGNKMNLDELSEFTQFLTMIVNPTKIEIKQYIEEQNRSEVRLYITREEANRLNDKLIFEYKTA